MAYQIDLNSDMGESFGAYKIGGDEEIIKYVTSANVACGFHAVAWPWAHTRDIRTCWALAGGKWCSSPLR